MCKWSTKQPQTANTYPRHAQTESSLFGKRGLLVQVTCWTTKVLLSFFSSILNPLMPPMKLMYVLKRGCRRNFVELLVQITEA